MAKKISDVIPRDKKTIRHIPLPKGRKRKIRVTEPVPPPEEEVFVEDRQEEVEEVRERPRRRKGRMGPILLAGVALVILIFFIFTVFLAGATVTVVPNSEEREVKAVITGASAGEPLKELAFEKIDIVKRDALELQPDGERKVERRASGKVVVYNNYSSEPQRLIKNTRFESPKGLIYRINESIVIPGKRTESGKTVPGSIEVMVYADSPGAEYNADLTDFTIPGFKGDTERYKNFYARGKTKIEGGFIGMEKYVSDEKRKAATDSLRSKLAAALRKEASASIPEGYILYEGAHNTAFAPINAPSDGKTVILSEEGSFTGYLLKTEDLSKVIAKRAGFDDADAKHRISVSGLDRLLFSFQGTPTATAMSFKLEGKPLFIWKFDENKLKELLAGKPKEDSELVLKGFIGIRKADIVTRPFWRNSFPKDPDDIEVETVLP